jgi:hypothetical protein
MVRSVSGSRRYQVLTANHYSVASCSVPIVFSPSSIVEKDPVTGEHIQWNPSQQYMDGSVDNDLPMTRLSEMFNVNHFIVSQVNPHVVPFLDNAEVISGPEGMHTAEQTISETAGLWGTVSGIAKSEILHRMHQLSELGVFPTTLTKFRSVMSQKYSGDITIVPEVPLFMVPRVLQNPDQQFMERALLCGERATWPKLSRIQNHLAIELAIDKAIARISAKIAFSPSQVNLRLMSLDRRRSSSAVKHGDPMAQSTSRLAPRARSKTKSWCAPQMPLTPMSMSQQLPTSVGFRLNSDAALEDKLRASIVQSVQPTGQMSDSESDDEDEDGGGFFIDLSSRRKRREDPYSSAEHNASGADKYDSATSTNLRSRSPSPADDDSPDPGPKTLLWPVMSATEPLFPLSSRNRRKSSPPAMVSPPITSLAPTMSEELPERRRWVDLSGTRAMLMRKKVMR